MINDELNKILIDLVDCIKGLSLEVNRLSCEIVFLEERIEDVNTYQR